MAAHALTGLNQLKEGQFTLESIRDGLNIDCWTSDLLPDDYTALDRLWVINQLDKSKLDIIRWAIGLIPLYEVAWKYLGHPPNREGWHESMQFETNFDVWQRLANGELE